MSGAFSIPLAIVSEISGTVLARSRNGAYRFLRKGDGVYESDVLITENNSSLRLQSENGVFLDMRGGTEVVLNVDLFIDRHCAGEEDASSFSAGEAAHVPMASIKEAVLKSDIVNRGIHGYLRVARISDDPEHASYLFTSYTGDYDATFDGRTAIGNLFSDGRATTDPRIVMSTSTLTFTQVETSSRITPVTSGFSEKRFHADSDDIPAAVNDEYSVSQGGSLMIIAPGILSNDSIGSDGGALSVVSHTNPGHGTLMLNADGSFTYTPDADYHGPDSYTYTIRDADGDTSTAAVSVTVTPIEDDPKANPDMNSVKVNNTIIVGVSNGVILSGGNPAGLDTDPDGDSLTVIGFTTGKAGSTTEAGSSGVGVSIAGAYGHLALHADGSYSYSADTESSRALAPGETAEDIFSYAISDGNGGSSFTTLTITVTGTAPDEQLVNEDALTNPPNLSEGESEFTGDVSSVTGSLAALFADSGSSGTRHYMVESGTSAGDPDPLVHTATGNTLLSKGVGVHYTTDSSGTVLSGYADVDGDGSYTGGMDRVVFTLTVNDASTGAYTFALNDQVDHPANGDAGTLSLDLAPYVSLTEAAGERVTAASGLVFVLENDVPSAKENVQEMTVKPIDTNLTIMLDCSESMLFNDPEGLAFDAARNLVDEYDELGDVRVQIILFGENAEVRSVWVGPDEAGAILDALDPENSYNQSWTNYDVALVKMMEIYGNEGRLSTPATQNVSYFISDGQPNRPEGSAGIDGSEEAQWEAFLETNGIDSYALGIGTVISLDAQQPVAYNGSSGTERDAVLVPDVNDLSGVLSDTVVPG
ncbi:MAG: cadherin-like domain-containing protein, partial [Chlorobiaceae bacterium]|nr:cadherin-like domain-containing protein [Chlorobiaceae bacterium]